MFARASAMPAPALAHDPHRRRSVVVHQGALHGYSKCSFLYANCRAGVVLAALGVHTRGLSLSLTGPARHGCDHILPIGLPGIHVLYGFWPEEPARQFRAAKLGWAQQLYQNR